MTLAGDLTQIDGLDEAGAGLLAAVGVEDLKSLALSDAGDLHFEIEEANILLQITNEVPGLGQIREWIDTANQLSTIEKPVVALKGQVEGAPMAEAQPVPQLVEESSLTAVPTAIPVSPKYLQELKVSVSDVPVMEILTEGGGSVRPAPDPPQRELTPSPPRADNETKLKDFASDVISLRKSTSSEEIPVMSSTERRKIEPLQNSSSNDIRKKPSANLNVGRKEHSRSYIRGVLHPQPFRVKFGAFVTSTALLLVPLTFIAGLMIILKYPAGINHLWLAIIPGLFIFFAILYVLFARSLKCRICGQPLFSPKTCRRHTKAHRIPLIGYILPTSLQLLIFHWFRCIYCGTSVRLKE